MKPILSGSALLLLALVASAPLRAETTENAESPDRTAPQRYIQSWLGAADTDEAWTLDDPETQESLSGDLDWLPYGGGAGQSLWGEQLQYGFEGGGLLAWKSDRVAFFGQNGNLRIQVDNRLFVLDLFMGGVLAAQPTNWIRFYAAAGPALAWAHLDGDNDDVQPEPLDGGVFINLSDSSDDLSIVLYGRAGVDFVLANGFTVGLSARYANHEFDFDERGRVEFDELQWFLHLGTKI